MGNLSSTRRWVAGLFVLLAAWSTLAVSLAASPPSSLIINQDRAQKKTIENEIRRRLEQRPAVGAPKIDVQAPVLLPDGQCQKIAHVWLYGADHFPAGEQQSLFQPYLGECLDNAAIFKLVRKVQDWYLRAGYITTRSRIKQPQSSLDQGNLEIWVVEGRIGRFILGNNSSFDRSRVRAAFPVSAGDVLNIHDLDQGLEQLNRLYSQHLRMQIKPGERPGYSDVLLIESANQDSRLFPAPPSRNRGRQQLSYQYNNGGVKATGEDLQDLKFSRENLFGFNETLSAAWQRGIPYHKGHTENETRRFNATLPWGYWLFKLNYYKGKTLQQIHSGNYSFLSSSRIGTTGLSVNRTVSRTQKSKTELFSKLEYSNRESYVNNTQVLTASRVVSSLALGVTYTHYFDNSTLIVVPSMVVGVPWFGALSDPASPGINDPRAQYTLFQLYSFYRQRFFARSRYSFNLQHSLSAQYSADPLFGEKQFVIGGEYSVRGFKENVLSDDSGITLRNDLLLPIGAWITRQQVDNTLTPLNFKLFLDVASTYSASGGARESLAGGGYGLDYHYRWFDLHYNRALALDSSNVFASKEGWVNYYGANMTLTF